MGYFLGKTRNSSRAVKEVPARGGGSRVVVPQSADGPSQTVLHRVAAGVHARQSDIERGLAGLETRLYAGEEGL